jgi:hypothetical protein
VTDEKEQAILHEICTMVCRIIVVRFWNGQRELRLFVGPGVMSALRQIALLYRVRWALL